MSNAAKLRKKAAEFEQLKQIDRAIASYIKAIEESETAGEDVDVILLNKVGDLALRQGRVPDAITYYERAVEHYATSGLFNNAIALCNKILRSAPGRANVYFTLGRICARKGLRGDATKNFLEYATRMREEGKTEEGMRALAEIVDLSPELTEIRKLVDEYAVRAGIALPRRVTPAHVPAIADGMDARRSSRDPKSQDLVFIHVDYAPGHSAPKKEMGRTPARVAAVTAKKTPARPVDALAAAIIEPGPGFQFAQIKVTPSALAAIVDVPAHALTDDLSAIMIEPGPVEKSATTLAATSDEVLVDFSPTVPLDGIEASMNVSAEADDDEVSVVLPMLDVDEPLSDLDDEPIALPMFDLDFGPAHGDDESVVLPMLDLDDGPSATKETSDETSVDLPMLVVDLTPIDVEAVAPPMDQASASAPDPIEAEAVEPGVSAPSWTPLDTTVVRPLRNTPLMVDVDLDAVAEHAPATRPPFRVDPHDFILPGELPPLLLDDAIVDAGLAGDTVSARRTPRYVVPLTLTPASLPTAWPTPIVNTALGGSHESHLEAPRVSAGSDEGLLDVGDELAALGATADAPSVAASADVPALRWESAHDNREGPPTDAAQVVGVSADDADPTGWNAGSSTLSPTPSLPIAAIAAEATIVATSRRDALRTAVTRLPTNWLLRRRLAEALFEAGDTEEALTELETARQGLLDEGELSSAADIGEELVHVSPDRIAYHQRRVELAVRMHDLQRLRMAYLDLADALVRLGEEARARAVYARVLEIDPLDDRARAALGAAAPPPPPPSARPDDDFVDLSTWLKEEEGGVTPTTRLRMREPVISGDEQADFDELLRHFKEGVARSLGEDDFESHYDLGVAYKEMGLLDDAVGEFQKALRSRGNRLPAYEALGQCFVEQGRHQVAATVLSRALHEPGLGDEQRVGVLYLLAFSCEALQRYDESRSYYQRVYATDIHFRDVAARLAALDQVAQ